MKKIFKFALVLVAVVGIIALLSSITGEKFDDDRVGQKYEIRWDSVNVRETAGISWKDNIITSITRGTDVTLTGYTYDLGDGPNSDWTQIQLEDGTVGWIVTESIDWHGELRYY